MRDITDVGTQHWSFRRSVVATFSNASAVCGTVLFIGRLTKSTLSDEVAQDDQARCFAKPEEPRGLMSTARGLASPRRCQGSVQ